MGVRHAGDGSDIADIAGRIAHRFAEDGAGVLVDAGGQRLGAVTGGKTALDALPRQHGVQQGVRGAVKLRHRDDVLARLRDIGEGIVQRRLAGCGGQARGAAFQRRDALFQHRHGGIGDAAVAVALFLEIEERRTLVGGIELIGSRLVDRHRHRLGGGIGVKACVQGDGFSAHECPGMRYAFYAAGINKPSAQSHTEGGSH